MKAALEETAAHGELTRQTTHLEHDLPGARGPHHLLGLGIQKGLGVGRLWLGEDGLHRPRLHQPTGLHDTDRLGKTPHHGKVVGDEQNAHARLFLEGDQEIQHLLSQGHVQRGGRLISNEQGGPTGQGHGNQRTLALPTRELMRIGHGAALWVIDAHAVEQADRPLVGLLAGQPFMQLQHLANLAANGEQRVEGRHGFLEDHGDLAAAQGPASRLGRLEQGLPAPKHLTRTLRLGQQAEDAQRRDRLARTGLAHQGHPLTPVDAEVQARHSLSMLAIGRVKCRGEPPHLEQDICGLGLVGLSHGGCRGHRGAPRQ